MRPLPALSTLLALTVVAAGAAATASRSLERSLAPPPTPWVAVAAAAPAPVARTKAEYLDAILSRGLLGDAPRGVPGRASDIAVIGTVVADDPARSSALVAEGRRTRVVRVGEALGEGGRVVAIDPLEVMVEGPDGRTVPHGPAEP